MSQFGPVVRAVRGSAIDFERSSSYNSGTSVFIFRNEIAVNPIKDIVRIVFANDFRMIPKITATAR